ncbi:MAG: preprotein translocase subunit SecG [Beggiatoa sp.]|nr:preprotein translocase subunit SecG [Beggiatoa sp.]
MQALFLVLHVLVGIGLITLILLQHGKGADAGAAFGSGASATVFGARGSATFLTKATAVLALLFFSNSFLLNYLSANTTGPKSVIEEKEDNLPTGTIESTIAPIEKESEPPVEAPQSDLPALPGESGRGVTGSDVPPAPVSPSPGSQGSDPPLPEAGAPESPGGESRSAAPNLEAPAADPPKDAPAAGEGEAGASPKPAEGVESKSAQPAESGPTAGPNAETSAEPTPEAASPKATEPPSAAAGKEPSAPAKPPATAPEVPAKKTQTATDKPATKRTPEPETTKRQPSTGKSTSSTDKKKKNETP